LRGVPPFDDRDALVDTLTRMWDSAIYWPRLGRDDARVWAVGGAAVGEAVAVLGSRGGFVGFSRAGLAVAGAGVSGVVAGGVLVR
jgi:hypothetical protein